MKNKITLLFALLVNTRLLFAQASVTMTITPPDTNICSTQLVKMKATVTACSPNYTIAWIRDGITMSTTPNGTDSFTTTLPTSTHQLYCQLICVTQGHPYSNIFNMVVNNCAGIEELDASVVSTAYPNPAEGIVRIDYVAYSNTIYELLIFDSTGKKLAVKYELKGNSYFLNTTQFSKGLYYYMLTNEKGKKNSVGKFMIAD